MYPLVVCNVEEANHMVNSFENFSVFIHSFSFSCVRSFILLKIYRTCKSAACLLCMYAFSSVSINTYTVVHFKRPELSDRKILSCVYVPIFAFSFFSFDVFATICAKILVLVTTNALPKQYLVGAQFLAQLYASIQHRFLSFFPNKLPRRNVLIIRYYNVEI